MMRQMNRINGPICGVFAATMATQDVPFIVVKNIADEEMGKKGRWKGRMHLRALKGVLERLCVPHRDVDGIRDIPMRKAATSLNPMGHYILFVTGHFCTIHNGKGYDQANPNGTPIESFWCAGKNVMHVLEIDRAQPLPTYQSIFGDEDEQED